MSKIRIEPNKVFIDPVNQQFTKKQVYKLLFGQLIGLVILTMIAFGLLSEVIAYSAGLAGLISWIPSAYFAWRVFGVGGVSNPKLVVRQFFRGALEKFIISISLFALVMLWVRPLHFSVFLMSYVVCMIGIPFSTMLFGRRFGNT